MDTVDIARVCAKRWYVFVPLMVLALAGGYGYAKGQPTSYKAEGGLALIPPTPTQAGQLDPNAFGSGGETLLQNALVADLNSPATQVTLAPPASKVSYEVDVETSPLIHISATGNDRTQVLAATTHVLSSAGGRLDIIQNRAGIPKRSLYTSFVANPATITNTSPPSKVKLLAAFGGLGLLLAAGLCVLLDGILVRRRQRAGPAAPTAADAAVLDRDDTAPDDQAAVAPNSDSVPRTPSPADAGISILGSDAATSAAPGINGKQAAKHTHKRSNRSRIHDSTGAGGDEATVDRAPVEHTGPSSDDAPGRAGARLPIVRSVRRVRIPGGPGRPEPRAPSPGSPGRMNGTPKGSAADAKPDPSVGADSDTTRPHSGH